MPGSVFVFSLIGAVLAAAVLEFLSLKRWNHRITLECSLDMRLTEPGERMTFTYRIRSTAFWPMSSVSVAFLFDNAIEILEEGWEEKLDGGVRTLYSRDTGLMPRRVLRGTIPLSCTARGDHPLGRVYLETGDFLGLHPVVRAFDIPVSVICTAAPAEIDRKVEPIGGLLGDVSVRRFIMEDPSIILGYREYSGVEPMKSISWLQTARTGRLTVKKHDFTVDTDIAIVLDIEACRQNEAEHCLSLVRTVCDELERQKIPYSLFSNGDLQSPLKGVGRAHCFEIQRRIGVSRFVRRLGISSVLARCAADNARRGYILIAPKLTDEIRSGLRMLQSTFGSRVLVLTGKEAGDDA